MQSLTDRRRSLVALQDRIRGILDTEARQDSRVWVKDPSVKGGGYYRRGKKASKKASKKAKTKNSPGPRSPKGGRGKSGVRIPAGLAVVGLVGAGAGTALAYQNAESDRYKARQGQSDRTAQEHSRYRPEWDREPAGQRSGWHEWESRRTGSSEADRDWHTVLGVPENATKAEVMKAYRSLAKKHHPDIKGGNTEEATREMQRINAAKDAFLRRRRDSLRQAVQATRRDTERSRAIYPRSSGRRHAQPARGRRS